MIIVVYILIEFLAPEHFGEEKYADINNMYTCQDINIMYTCQNMKIIIFDLNNNT
jgi:hypothetical protein